MAESGDVSLQLLIGRRQQPPWCCCLVHGTFELVASFSLSSLNALLSWRGGGEIVEATEGRCLKYNDLGLQVLTSKSLGLTLDLESLRKWGQ